MVSAASAFGGDCRSTVLGIERMESPFFQRGLDLLEGAANFGGGSDGEVEVVFEGEAGRDGESGDGGEVGAGAVFGVAAAVAIAGEFGGDGDKCPDAKIVLINVGGPMFGDLAGFVGPARLRSLRGFAGPGMRAVVKDQCVEIGFGKEGGNFLGLDGVMICS